MEREIEIKIPFTYKEEENTESLLGIWRFSKNSVGAFLRGFKSLIRLKDKKVWVPIAILACLWLVLMVLEKVGINIGMAKWLQYITFSSGGLRGGLSGLVGGMVGKGMVAFFLMDVLMPVVYKKKTFTSMNPFKKGNWSKVFMLKNKPLKIVQLLTGLALGLIAYNFITVYGNSSSGVIAIIGAWLSLNAMSKSNGFMTKLIRELTGLFRRNKKIGTSTPRQILGGMAIGFTVALGLTRFNFVYLHYALGGLVLLAALIIRLVNIKKGGTVNVK